MIAAHLGLERVLPRRPWDALQALGWSLQRPRPRNPKSANPEEAEALKKLADVVAEEAAAHPGATVEVFCTGEHRLGLKPVLRAVWAPMGQRPVALGHHRFQWLYVTAFVGAATGETVRYLSNGVSKPLFAGLLAAFAEAVGVGPDKRVVLLLNNAGFHTRPNVAVPDGIRLVDLPPDSPELQPAETLWPLVVTTHGVQSVAERRQAPIVPSTVLNVPAPEVIRAAASTVRTAASPLADHMAQ